MRIIAFAGPKGAGKDTAAKYLLARSSLLRANLFVQINFADPLKNVCGQMFGLSWEEMNDPVLKEKVLDRWPFQTPRALMQSVANTFRTLYSPDIFARAWERKMLSVKVGCIVITDLRHPEEVELLETYQAKIVYVSNKKVEAARTAGIAAGDPLWSDSSEAFADMLRTRADKIIDNDGADINKLHANVEVATKELLGDWNEWPEMADTNPQGVKL